MHTDSRTRPTKWFALALICAVQFMVILDIAIVNVALPSIQLDLGFSQENLQWVISAYALVFGGFLLLGGRLADLLGRRRVFMAGLVDLHRSARSSAASRGARVADRRPRAPGPRRGDDHAVRRSRSSTTTFAEGRERNIALGAWGAVGGFGAAAGVLFGGILTDLLSWEWIFFVNVPVGIAGLALAPILLAESRDAHGRATTFRAPCSSLGARPPRARHHAGPAVGWGSGKTIGVFAAAAVLLVAFVLWERRAERPARPVLDLPAADADGRERRRLHHGHGAVLDVPDADALHAAGARVLAARDGLRLPRRRRHRGHLGERRRAGREPGRGQAGADLRDGMLTVGLLYFTQVSVDGSYWADLFPGFLILGLAIPFAFVPITIAALAGTKPRRPGSRRG